MGMESTQELCHSEAISHMLRILLCIIGTQMMLQ